MAATAAALCVAAVPAYAQVKVNMKVGRPENFNKISPNKVGLTKVDKTYLQNAYFANAFEAKIGALAMSHGQDEWVKDFGQDMYREHNLANSELKQLAQAKMVSLSNNWPKTFVATYTKLSGLYGAKFDYQFQKINKQGHMMVMNACAKEIKRGHDASVRGYATKMLATARSHEQLVLTRQTMLVHTMNSYGSAAQPIKP